MATSKADQFEQEQKIFACRHETGTQSMRAWLFARRDKVNMQWLTAVGDDLLRLQGEAKLIQRQIDMIDTGPTIQGEKK